MKFDLYTQSGEKNGQIEANDQIFGIEPNKQLVHLALVRQMGNARKAIAHTKTRGEVRGSTRKIYRQKGTGGARHGSKYANLFRGGGVIFGPRNVRNYTKAMPRKQRRLALFSALSLRAKDKSIIGLEAFVSEAPKSKVVAEMLKKLPVKENILIIEPEKSEILEKSARNLSNAKVIPVEYLNVSDVLKFKTIVFLKEAFKKTEEHYLSSSSK